MKVLFFILLLISLSLNAFCQTDTIIEYWHSDKSVKKFEKVYKTDTIAYAPYPIDYPDSLYEYVSKYNIVSEEYWDENGNSIPYERFVLKYSLYQTISFIDELGNSEFDSFIRQYPTQLDSIYEKIKTKAKHNILYFDTNFIVNFRELKLDYYEPVLNAKLKIKDSIASFRLVIWETVLYDSNDKIILVCNNFRTISMCYKQWWVAIQNEKGYYFKVRNIYLKDEKGNFYYVYGNKRI